jgi:hypothetical protein
MLLWDKQITATRPPEVGCGSFKQAWRRATPGEDKMVLVARRWPAPGSVPCALKQPVGLILQEWGDLSGAISD